MKKLLSFIMLLLAGYLTLNAQSTQQTWPAQYFKGYMRSVAGEKLDYHSSHPSITLALLLRANKTFHSIAWESETIPAGFKGKDALFVWMYGMDADPKTFHIDLRLNGKTVVTFTNPEESSLESYTVKGNNGAEITFRPLILDMFRDPMGYAILKVPAEWLQKGKPQQFEAVSEDKGWNVWYMTFEAPVEEGVALSQEPVLVHGKSGDLMSVRAEFTHIGAPVKAQISLDKQVSGEVTLQPGYNSLTLQYPEVKKATSVQATIRVGEKPPVKKKVMLSPVKPWTVYLVQHTHTDIGYTRPQSEILPEHLRYIDFALDYCDQTDSLPDDARFRWTCETSWAVREYIKTRPQAQIDRLMKRIKEGRIEVTGLFLNMSDLSDEATLATSLQPVKDFQQMGIPVQSAMQDDVNGLGWCLADYLPSIGVKYMSMGQNTDRAIKPFNRPTPFWWESPSGSRLLVYRGEHYMWGNSLGVISGDIQSFGQNLFRDLSKFSNLGYPYNRIAVQFSGYFTDNSPPSTTACELVKEWNEKYAYPHLRMATVHEFPEYLTKECSKDLPVYRAAWPDWWTDGFGSAAIETAYARRNQSEMLASQTLLAMAMLKGQPLPEHSMERIMALRDAVNFYDEHTFGAAESISDPRTENSTVQWGEKSSYVWEGLLANRMLREDAMGLIQQFIPGTKYPTLAVFNTLGSPRSGVAEVFIDHQVLSPDKPFEINDADGNHIPAQLIRSRSEGSYWALYVRDIPPMGFKTYSLISGKGSKNLMDEKPFQGTLENEYYRITFDASKGTITSLEDKQLNLDLVDNKAPWGMAQFIYEQLGNRNQISSYKLDDFRRTPLGEIKAGRIEDGPVWTSVTFYGQMPGCAEKDGISCEIRLYRNEKRIELHYAMKKLPVTDPEGVYVAFPFRLDGGHIAFEAQGGVVVPGKDQLEGSSSDWNGIQNFASVRNDKAQIVITSPETPLMMFGDINLGKFQRISNPKTNNIYSWVMNNYWTTNFRASQEGELKWSYAITSADRADNLFASDFGWETRIPFLARVIPAGTSEDKQSGFSLLPAGTGSVMLVNAYPASNRKDIILQLREAGGQNAEVDLSGLLSLPTVKGISEVNVIETPLSENIQKLSFTPWQPRFLKVILK